MAGRKQPTAPAKRPRPASGRAQDQPGDSSLIEEVAGGNGGALTVLVHRYQRQFYAIARRMLSCDADAEDAVQRAFLQVLLHARTYSTRWKGSTWLYRILTNICVDAWRKQELRRQLFKQLTRVKQATKEIERLDLDAALTRLPPQTRPILLLCHLEGLSYRDVARVRGVTINTVKTQLKRGKRLLRSFLEEKDAW